ncbi:Lysosomal acid phosphatase [Trichinella nativa]|uniref:RNA-binding protein 42 n=1 Tax=Trichinella nativa TaxID=6335 RepID=A0A0V1L264_9BILA|nr:Lysosomal acid phosphatase [Trichinella nativa]
MHFNCEIRFLMQCILFLFLLFITASSVHDDLQSVATDDESFKLHLVQAIWRHGDRTPALNFSLNPDDIASWAEGPDGELTKLGILQQFRLGEYLRNRYQDFLPNHYSSNLIYVRSTDYNRTIMSALANLAGLFPPSAEEKWNENLPWQPIPVHSVPKNMDYVLNMEADCPLAKKAQENIWQSAEVLAIMKENQQFIDFLKNKTGLEFLTLHDMVRVFDPINCAKIHSDHHVIPDWVTEEIFEKIHTLFNISTTFWMSTPEVKKFRGSYLIWEIIDRMKAKSSGMEKHLKFYAYSAHDLTLIAFLNHLEVYSKSMFPAYCSIILIELLEKDGQYFVQLFYKNGSTKLEPLELNFCKSPCSLFDFEQKFSGIYIPDWKDACKLHEMRIEKTMSSGGKSFQVEMENFEKEIAAQNARSQAIGSGSGRVQANLQFLPHSLQRPFSNAQMPAQSKSTMFNPTPAVNQYYHQSAAAVIEAAPSRYTDVLNRAGEADAAKFTSQVLPQDVNLVKSRRTESRPTTSTATLATTFSSSSKSKAKKPARNLRTAGGCVWEDLSLNEWDPDDFRLFCGDLGNEVSDELLSKAFRKYPSFLKAKVVRDKRSNKTKGYGFVSFKDPQDFIRALREMDGKYVGNRPIKLRKSSWKDRNLDAVRKKCKEKQKLGLRISLANSVEFGMKFHWVPFIGLVIILMLNNNICSGTVVQQSPGELRLLQVIWRHGDRTPAMNFPLNPDKVWSEGTGELTKLGILQQYELGRFLRHRYENFLPKNYSSHEVFIRSTDVNRTLMSALANLAALFEPNSDDMWNKNLSWQPIPVHTVPRDLDNVLNLEAKCPAAEKLQIEVWHSSEAMSIVKANEALFELLRLNTGLPMNTLEEISTVYDPLHCAVGSVFIGKHVKKIHEDKHSIPHWVTDEVYENITRLFNISTTFWCSSEKVKKFRGSYLVVDIIERMKRKAGYVDENLKFYAYSAHDETLIGFLEHMRVYDATMVPTYASIILIELLELRGKYYVQMYFKNGNNSAVPLRLEFCPHPCSLEKFEKNFKDITPLDWFSACGLQSMETIAWKKYASLFFILFILSVSMFLAQMAFIISQRRSEERHFHTTIYN